MEVTRRFWGTAGSAGLLALLAVVFARPTLLLGTVLLGAWLVATQFAFVRAVTATRANLDVTVDLAPATIATDEVTVVSLDVRLPDGAPTDLVVEVQIPVTGDAPPHDEHSVQLKPNERIATTTFDVTWPIAGTYTLKRSLVTITDRHGYFREQIPHGNTPAVTVEPRSPRSIHVGVGGSQIAAYGDHDAGQLGAGLDPAELREYEPGDAADRIDWKATARLNTAYVREYDAETDRQTLLLVDHRNHMAVGPPGETKLDYLRQVGLAIVQLARRHGDPLGLCTVGDDGVTAYVPPQSSQPHYVRLRRHLSELTPTQTGSTPQREPSRVTPAAARRASAVLDTDETAFGSTLRPYFANLDPYVTRIETDPLVGAVRTHLARLRGRTWTVLLTDDAKSVELHETAKLLHRADGRVSAFLAPTVLYEPGGLANLEDAYKRYLDFEEGRRTLASLPRVTAYEVGPGDRIEAILAAHGTPTPNTASQ